MSDQDTAMPTAGAGDAHNDDNNGYAGNDRENGNGQPSAEEGGRERQRSRSRSPYESSGRRGRDSYNRSRSRSRSPRRRPPPAPPGKTEAPPSNVLGCFNLSIRTKDIDLEDEFGRVGEVEKAVVVYDQRSERSRGFGFVTMRTEEDAMRAIEKLNGIELHGRNIRVAFSTTTKPHQSTPGQYMGFKDGLGGDNYRRDGGRGGGYGDRDRHSSYRRDDDRRDNRDRYDDRRRDRDDRYSSSRDYGSSSSYRRDDRDRDDRRSSRRDDDRGDDRRRREESPARRRSPVYER